MADSKYTLNREFNQRRPNKDVLKERTSPPIAIDMCMRVWQWQLRGADAAHIVELEHEMSAVRRQLQL